MALAAVASTLIPPTVKGSPAKACEAPKSKKASSGEKIRFIGEDDSPEVVRRQARTQLSCSAVLHIACENVPSALIYTGLYTGPVSIDAGDALVDRIKPMVKSTRRSGADGTIGGFGGAFDLKAAGYNDPILISGTDGVGTKLRIAIDTGRLDTVGIDLVAMCANDVLANGAESRLRIGRRGNGGNARHV